MTVAVITFGSNAVQISGSSGLNLKNNNLCSRIRVTPLASNSHRCYVGSSAVTNNGDGTGVIKELAAGSATVTVLLDTWETHASGGLCQLDASQYYVHGYSAEKCLVYVEQPN